MQCIVRSTGNRSLCPAWGRPPFVSWSSSSLGGWCILCGSPPGCKRLSCRLVPGFDCWVLVDLHRRHDRRKEQSIS